MNMSEVDREQLAADNMKLVYFVLKKYYPTFAGNEEIIGCGMYGLARACKYYNPDEGVEFSTFAVSCIRSEISHGIRRELKYENNKVSLETELSDDGNFHDILEGEPDAVNVSWLDTKEFSNKLNGRENKIVEMRKLGYTDYEIGEQLGVTHQRVNQLRKNINKKWEEFNNDN